MSVEIEVKAKATITGAQMGELFWGLDGDEQAAFFSALAEVAGNGAAIHTQMQWAADKTTGDGRGVMEIIGGSVDA